MSLYLCWVGIAQSLKERDRGARHVERALQANTAELAWRPDVIRIRGELLRRPGHTDRAEADFREAIGWHKN